MAGRSAVAAGLISSGDMDRQEFEGRKRKAPAAWPGLEFLAGASSLVALSQELQQQREQVDEVEVERERAADGRPLRYVTALRGIAVDVVVLQPLRIPGGEPREHQH